MQKIVHTLILLSATLLLFGCAPNAAQNRKELQEARAYLEYESYVAAANHAFTDAYSEFRAGWPLDSEQQRGIEGIIFAANEFTVAIRALTPPPAYRQDTFQLIKAAQQIKAVTNQLTNASNLEQYQSALDAMNQAHRNYNDAMNRPRLPIIDTSILLTTAGNHA